MTISPLSEVIIQELVAKTGKTKTEVIEEALKLYRFRQRIHAFNESYEKLQCDENAWSEEVADRDLLEGTLIDGLEEE